MTDKRRYKNEFINLIFGPLFGLISVIVYFSGIIIAFILYSGFDFNNMISWLGGENSPGSIFFNLGVILSGILAVPLYIHIDRRLRKEKGNNNLKRIAISSALISCMLFSLIGAFPSSSYNILSYYLHGIFFLICMITAISYLLIFSVIFFHSDQFPRALSYLGFLVIIVIILFLFTWIPLIEWIMTFTIGVWILSISIYLLIKVS
ncbi:MAG: DUF998 domain-containing protein [Promethearchaeota archaeon]